MNINRRSLITSAAALGAASLAPQSIAQAAQKQRIKLSISSYSYWHFTKTKYPIESVIDRAAELGVEGVDVLHRQMQSEDNAYMQKIKKHAFQNGIDLICLSIHQDFVSPDAEERKKHIEHTKHCIELAYAMGIPCIRLNSGRWGTIKSFDDLMAARGLEPPLDGYGEDDAFKWCIDSIEQCLPKAEECGVLLALENHWGLSRTPEGMLRIFNGVDSPWLTLMMDTGNFLENPYDKLAQVAPYVSFVQAKTYYGGGEWYTLNIDYDRVASILKAVDYNGYVSIEFEGKESADTGVSKSVELLRKSFS
ncbi:MAG: sugar phosphate isomerase/epimerase family protein [Candidatus Hinthialibacter antarcticus]|nr:sugar phosphate isomerase/epimerase family protein [Candidatus Hinthialibacter antarcticus]